MRRGLLKMGFIEGHTANRRTLPPLESKPSKRKKKKRKGRITPQSSVDGDDGWFCLTQDLATAIQS